MPKPWYDRSGAVVADNIYKNGKLIASDVTVTLPEVTRMTTDINVMGTYEMPISSMIESMEAAFTKAGVDTGLAEMFDLAAATYEVRWAQDVQKNDGTVETIGCKAFLRGSSKTIPGISLEVGNVSENEATIAVSRYQLFINGQERLLVDQFNSILKVNGKDFTARLANLL